MSTLQFHPQEQPRRAGDKFAAPLPGQKARMVREKEYKKYHSVYDGAPCEWSLARGATHTLWISEFQGTRPAKLLKTVLYVGTDEENDEIVWEKWLVE